MVTAGKSGTEQKASSARMLGEKETVLKFDCSGPGPHSPKSGRTLIIGAFPGRLCRACFEKARKDLGLYGLATYEADKDPKHLGSGRATER